MIAAVSALLVLAALAADDAPSASPVSIQRSDDADAVVLEASLRLRSELAVAGYTGQIVACAVDVVKGPVDCPQREAQDSISLARVEGSSSIFATSVLPGGRRWQRRLRVTDDDGGNDATLLAVRAVELLRDVQIHLAASTNDSEEPTPLEPFAQLPPRVPPQWALLAGVSTLVVPWTTQAALFPVFGATLGVGRPVGSRAYALVEAAGPYLTYLPIAAEATQAGLQDRALFQLQALASGRLGWSSPQNGPFAALRGGMRFMHVQLGASNLKGKSDSTVWALGGVGVGYALPLNRRVFATVELHIDLCTPVQIEDNSMPPVVLESTGYWSGGLDLTVAIVP